jgi:uncharacterized protein (DUF433 family)
MSTSRQSIVHPHIKKDPDVCGGSPVIEGTRFPVRSVVFYALKIGLTPEEIVEKFPHLSLAQIYDALAYYYDNRVEIEQDILENTEETVRGTKD